MKNHILICLSLFLCISSGISSAQEIPTEKHSDDISRHYIGIKGGGGIDHLFVLNAQAGVYFMPFSWETTRISIDNSVAAFVPMLWFARYYYPSVRLHKKIYGHWFSCSYGKEILWITDLFEEPGRVNKRTVDHRIDISYIYEVNDRFNIEINLPIRIDDQIPVFLTGVNSSVVLKL